MTNSRCMVWELRSVVAKLESERFAEGCYANAAPDLHERHRHVADALQERAAALLDAMTFGDAVVPYASAES